MTDYPKVKYLRTLETVMVTSSEEEAALVGEWGDGPMDFGIITAPADGQAPYDPSLDKFKVSSPVEPLPEPIPEPGTPTQEVPEPPATQEPPPEFNPAQV